jgi:hypothetical protein
MYICIKFFEIDKKRKPARAARTGVRERYVFKRERKRKNILNRHFPTLSDSFLAI